MNGVNHNVNFPIETYTVRFGWSEDSMYGRIILSSPTMYHGITNTAELHYSSHYRIISGRVQNLTGLNFDGIHVVAKLPIDVFDRHLHLLQTESPLTLFTLNGGGTGPNAALISLLIGSGLEFPGEGPIDFNQLEEREQAPEE